MNFFTNKKLLTILCALFLIATIKNSKIFAAGETLNINAPVSLGEGYSLAAGSFTDRSNSSYFLTPGNTGVSLQLAGAINVAGLSIAGSTISATPTQLNYLSGVSGTTGTGNMVRSTSPTLVTPILGTPTSVTLTNGTGLPISTGVSGLGTGVATFLGTPTSANLASALTNETGTGSVVFSAAPTLTGNVTIDTPTFTVDSTNNRVGIGTATPYRDLEIYHLYQTGNATMQLTDGEIDGSVNQFLTSTSNFRVAGITNPSITIDSGYDAWDLYTSDTSGTFVIRYDTNSKNFFAINITGDVTMSQNVTGATTTMDIAGTATLNGLCHSGTGTNDQGIRDCSGTPSDIAEFYPGQIGLTPGDVVSLVYDSNTGHRAVKSLHPYDQNAFGVVSTLPTGPLGAPMGEGTIPDNQHPQAIALTGKVPIKVSLENGPIAVGDYLTTSSTPGVAMKATKTSRVIARAIENYIGIDKVSDGVRKQESERNKFENIANAAPLDPPSGVGKILAVANLTQYTPESEIQEFQKMKNQIATQAQLIENMQKQIDELKR